MIGVEVQNTVKAVYGADVNLPGMKTAVIARPPVVGGSVKSFDATAALAVPGYNLALYYGQQHGVPAPVASLTTALGATLAGLTWLFRRRDEVRRSRPAE